MSGPPGAAERNKARRPALAADAAGAFSARGLGSCLLMVWLPLVASGAPIPGLFSTGVDSAGAPLPAGAVDPHWLLAQSADGSRPGPETYVVREGFPIPPWLANDATSKWIAPQADQSGGNQPGDYVYRTSFSLEGFEPATASITGRWSSDNAGLEVRLNGASRGISYPGDFGGFSSYFILTNGFTEGTNTIEFVVNNAPPGVNPTGFRAELSGDAGPTSPPGTAPQIRTQPTDATVDFKETAQFSVGVLGSKPLAFQWRLGGKVLAGATNAALVVPYAGPLQAGSYTVVVTNAFGAATSAVAVLRIVFPNPAQLAREPPGPSSRRTGIAITEIHYHPGPEPDATGLEFLELYNSNPFFEDLSGWRLTGDVDYTFPVSAILGGNAWLVVAAQPERLKAHYGITNVVGPWSGRLPRDSGTVRLRKRSDAAVLEIEYRDSPPWPVAADGTGHSLVLARPSYGEGEPKAWAASTYRGGSPGGPDPLPEGPIESVVINEILARPAALESRFVELANNSARPVDLSGCWLGDLRSPLAWRVPAGTVLGALEFAAFTNVDLTSVLSAMGGTLCLTTPDERRVVDARVYPAQPAGASSGRSPDAPELMRLDHPTRGRANAPPASPEVIIHELMYHPISGENDDEFVELRNVSTHNVDLSGWRFCDGISFTIPKGSALAPGRFLVVARNATRLLTNHAGLSFLGVVGNYDGELSDRGERVALARPDELVVQEPVTGATVTNQIWVLVDEVTYKQWGRWGRWADGGGSSLELVDGRSSRDLAPNWADSDESTKAQWTLVESTNLMDHMHPGFGAADQMQIILLGPGEALVDNVEARVGGVNRVSNGTFENGINGWLRQGTHASSRWEQGLGFDSAHSLRLVASERGDHVVNRVCARLSSSISAGSTVVLRARVRWLRGHPEILLRLRGGGAEAAGPLRVPSDLGTPGAANSRSLANAGPAIVDIFHRPALPSGGQPFRVMARVHDPDGVASVALAYRLDPSGAVVRSPMTDDGLGPDELRGDGMFTGMVPAQASGSLVAFRIEAIDAGSPEAVSRYPADDTECLVRTGEVLVPDTFGTYRFWMTREALDRWASREKMSNEDVDVTFVYNNQRIIYNAGAHYSGSSYTIGIYNTPTGNLCGYDLSFPKDNRFLGAAKVTLDWPIRDDTDQREQLMYWFLEQLGLPNMYRRYVHLIVNGVVRGTIYDDVQQPGADTVSEWFAPDDEGSLYKTDCWNEFDDGGNRIDPCILNTLGAFTTSGGVKKTARYRWNWRPRAVRQSANDFTDLFELVDVLNAKSNYVTGVEQVVDVDHWMRTFAMNDLASFWDAFGNGNAKNTFLYKPQHERWKLLCWDFDVGLGVFNDPPNAPLFDGNDAAVVKMNGTPAWIRCYWAALDEALNTFFVTGAGTAIDALLDAKYAAFRASNIPLASPSAIKSWINQRRQFLLTQTRTVQASFAITNLAGTAFSTNVSPLRLAGVAPVSLRAITVNGTLFVPAWKSVTSWELEVPLQPGDNRLVLAGVDRSGRAVPKATNEIRVTFTGSPAPQAPVVINEWMAANASAVSDPVDGLFDDWFELHNLGANTVSLAGWRLTDNRGAVSTFQVPPGFALSPGGFLLVWADEQPQQNQPGGGVDADLHATFRLDRGGDGIFVYAADGRLVDSVQFGSQFEDISQGRWPDGAPEPFYLMPSSTPRHPNAIPIEQRPRIRFIEVTLVDQDSLVLSWEAQPGRFYSLEYRDSVADADWHPLPGRISALGSVASTQVPVQGAGARFFRVALAVDR